MASESSSNATLSSQAHVLNSTLSFINSMSLKCAVDLGIADAIHRYDSPIPLPNLAAVLSIPPTKVSCLGRLMRVLSHAGFFALEADDEGGKGYVLTPASHRLRERGALHARLVLDQAMIMPWIHLSSWFHDDKMASFATTHGMSLWKYGERNPELNDLFNNAMMQDSDLVTGRIVSECGRVFDGVETLVDVGGGNGTVVRAIVAAFPHLTCTLFDLPHVVAGLSVVERVDYVEGSMFDFIPSSDAILIKRVLHDFDDEDCLTILRKCKEAIPSMERGGKVILVEMVIKADGHYGSFESQLLYDMQMMTIFGVKERDEQEWKSLFTKAGFTSYKIAPITELLCIIEILP